MRRKKYVLTPEHRAALHPWAQQWTANALSTVAMTAYDRDVCRTAVIEMYSAAQLSAPLFVVFVPSPFVLRFAAGFAAGLWYLFHQQATRSATRQPTEQATHQATAQAIWQAKEAIWQAISEATEQATRSVIWQATEQATRHATLHATEQATWQATEQVTRQATWQATWQATRQAIRRTTRQTTDQATEQATWHATEQATWQATWQATEQVTRQAIRQAISQATEQATWELPRNVFWHWTDFVPILNSVCSLTNAQFLLHCAHKISHLWQWGNQWSSNDSYLSFFRHVAGLDLPQYAAWNHWETLSLHSGPRVVHPQFAMISDRPEQLLLDEQYRPHCDTGPFCRWRDGAALYAVHGVFIPWWIIEQPEMVTITDIRTEENAEIRRIMLERFGWDRYMEEEGATLLDADTEPVGTPGLRGLFRCSDGHRLLVCCCASSGETYHLPVPQEVETCQQAATWLAQGSLQHLLVAT